MDAKLESLGDMIASARDDLQKARKNLGAAAEKLDRMSDIRRKMIRDHCEPKKSSHRAHCGKNSNHRGRSRRRSDDNRRRYRRSRSRSPRRPNRNVKKDSSPTILIRETPKSPEVVHDVNMYFMPTPSDPVSPSNVIPPCPDFPASEEDDEYSHPKTAIEILDEIFCDSKDDQQPTLDDRLNNLIQDGLLSVN